MSDNSPIRNERFQSIGYLRHFAPSRRITGYLEVTGCSTIRNWFTSFGESVPISRLVFADERRRLQGLSHGEPMQYLIADFDAGPESASGKSSQESGCRLTDSQSARSVHARIQNVCHCPRQISRWKRFSKPSLRSKALKSRSVLIQSSCATCIASAESMRYLRFRSRNARRPPSNNLHTDSRICGFSMLPL